MNSYTKSAATKVKPLHFRSSEYAVRAPELSIIIAAKVLEYHKNHNKKHSLKPSTKLKHKTKSKVY